MQAKRNSVLIAHDGSELSARVVDAAQPVLGPGRNVELVHVITAELDDLAGVDATAAQLEERGVAVSRNNPSAPDAAAALLKTIASGSSELVLMGTHGRSGSGRFIRGSVAERVMRECPAPLLMINPTVDAPLPPRSILVPLDASENSFEVIPPLLDVIAETDAHVTLLFVDFDDPTDTAELRDRRREQRKTDIANWLAEPAKHITSAGFTMDVRVEHGIAADVILQVANEPGYDMLAMTSHGRSGIARWALGSVAEKVLSECEKPVLLKRIH